MCSTWCWCWWRLLKQFQLKKWNSNAMQYLLCEFNVSERRQLHCIYQRQPEFMTSYFEFCIIEVTHTLSPWRQSCAVNVCAVVSTQILMQHVGATWANQDKFFPHNLCILPGIPFAHMKLPLNKQLRFSLVLYICTLMFMQLFNRKFHFTVCLARLGFMIAVRLTPGFRFRSLSQ